MIVLGKVGMHFVSWHGWNVMEIICFSHDYHGFIWQVTKKTNLYRVDNELDKLWEMIAGRRDTHIFRYFLKYCLCTLSTALSSSHFSIITTALRKVLIFSSFDEQHMRSLLLQKRKFCWNERWNHAKKFLSFFSFFFLFFKKKQNNKITK